jgi:hypothetical protein
MLEAVSKLHLPAFCGVHGSTLKFGNPFWLNGRDKQDPCLSVLNEAVFYT